MVLTNQQPCISSKRGQSAALARQRRVLVGRAIRSMLSRVEVQAHSRV